MMLRSAVLAALLALPAAAIAQADGYAMVGASGVPTAVLDESGQWGPALEVGHYRGEHGSEYRVFLPDITSPGWMAWHNAQFRKSGAYAVPYYLYDSSDHSTSQTMLVVDARNHTAEWRTIPFGQTILTLDLAGRRLPDVTSVVNHITAVVSAGAARFPGVAPEKIYDQERLQTLRDMQQAYHQ